MTAAEELLYDPEEPETMPMFQYKVTVPGQPARNLLAYGTDEAQALGPVVHALRGEAEVGTAHLPKITHVGTFPNPTVIEVNGTITAI